MINVIKNQSSISKTLCIDDNTSRLIHEAACRGLAELLDMCIINKEDNSATWDFDGAIIITKALQVIERPLSMNESLLLGYIINDILNDTQSQFQYLSAKYGVVIKDKILTTLNLN